MTFPNSLINVPLHSRINNSTVNDVQGTPFSPSVNHNSEDQVSQTGPLTPFDKFWQTLVSVGLADNKGIISEETIKKFPLESLNDDEFKTWFNLISEPIVTTFEIEFSMLEFYAFLLTVGPRVGVNIISTNIIGGINPDLFSNYYTRTWNNIYKSRCKELNRVSQIDLISKEIAEDMKRKSPDYDFATGVKGDLEVANDLTTKFLAWKLSKLIDKRPYNLTEAIREVLKFQNVGIMQTSSYQFSIEGIPKDCEDQIKKSFYNSYYKNKNVVNFDKCNSEFALGSFGKGDFVIDHTFVPYNKVGQTLFDHHSLIIPDLDPVIKFIEALNLTNLPPNAILEMNRLPKITPFHAFGRGVEAISGRLGKRLRQDNNVNDRAWSGYISNITIGYDGWEFNQFTALLNKVRVEDRLPFLKSRWKNHHKKDQIKDLHALIALGFNAMVSLPENSEHTNVCQIWWKEIKSWFEKRLLKLNTEQINRLTNTQLSFFMDLKLSLDKEKIPFSACRDLLQMFACLKLCTPQSKESSALKTCLSNPEAQWHNVKIYQKCENINYSLSIPLNLMAAIESILRLDDSQVDSITDLINHLRPTTGYDKRLIPTDLFIKKLLLQVEGCFKHSHKMIKKLGYELLLLHSFSYPQKENLTDLIKYLPLVIEDPLTMANLNALLDSFPDDEETHKVTSSLKKYCQSCNGISKNGCYEFCLSLAGTNQSSTVLSLYPNLKLTVEEQIKLVKALLYNQPQEANKVFSMLQRNNQIKGSEEIELFVKISEAILKNTHVVSHASQVLSLAECVKRVFRIHRMDSLLKPICDPILKIVNLLAHYGFISEAADLLSFCSDQQLTLISAHQETEAWLNVCEAGFKPPQTDIENLYGKWTRYCILKFDDQTLALRKKSVESSFKQQLYDQYLKALIALQNPGQIDKVSINKQIETHNSNIVKLLEDPELVDSALAFLEQMSSTELLTLKLYTNIAVHITLECAKETFKDFSKLERLEAAVRPYLDILGDTGKEYKVRQASLKIAQTLLVNKLPLVAMKWMQRIFKIAIPHNSSSIHSGKEVSNKEKEHLALISLYLPLNPAKVFEALTKMPIKELNTLSEISDQLPCSSFGEFVNTINSTERSILINHANTCLKHSHIFVQRMGFELLLQCGPVVNESKTVTIDLSLINDLIRYLPIILAVSGEIISKKLIERMKSLLQASIYADYAEAYLAALSVSKLERKDLYQANCKALAMSKHEPLLKIGKRLIDKESFDKLVPNLSQTEKIEIVLSYIIGILPENTALALACIKLYEKELNSTTLKEDVKIVFIALIRALIGSGEIEKAKEHLYNCVKNKTLPKGEIETTGLWLELLEKVMQEKLLSHISIAKLLLSLLRDGTISKSLLDSKQINYVIAVAETLFNSKDETSFEIAIKLITLINDSNQSVSQKAMCLQLIEKHIMRRLFKEGLAIGYKEIKCTSLMTEESKASLSKLFLEASIKYENLDLALEILLNLQDQWCTDSILDTFVILINKLLNACRETSVENKKFLQCYELLNRIDLKTKQSAKFEYSLQWMSIAKEHFGTTYSEERSVVLKMILQMMISEFHTEDSILEITDHLLSFLNHSEAKKSSVFTDLKLLIASCHSKFSQKLQSTTLLEKFCEYLNALQQSHFFGNHTLDILPQALWTVSELLASEKCSSSSLLEIHKLLNSFYGNPGLLENEGKIVKGLAKTLLAQQLPDEALIWIEFVKKALPINPSDSFFADCFHSLLSQNKPLLCLALLKGLILQPIDLAGLFLKVSKALQDNDLTLSVHIIADNWELLHVNCSQDILSEHMEQLIGTVFESSQKCDVLTLFSTLISIYKSQDQKFLIEQLKNCCALYDTTQTNTTLQRYNDRLLKTISSVFFDPLFAHPFDNSLKWTRYHLIRILLASKQRELFVLGIKKHNIHIEKLLLLPIIDPLWVWVEQSQKAIESCIQMMKDTEISLSESADIDQLLAHYSSMIKRSSDHHREMYEKSLAKYLFQISLHPSNGSESVALEYFLISFKKYFNDTDWVNSTSSFAVDALLKRCVRSNDYLIFLKDFKSLGDQFRNVDLEAFNKFHLLFIEKCLDSALNEGILRSMLLYQVGTSLEYLLKHYKAKSDKIILENGSLNQRYEKEVSKIVLLLERFLLVQPVLNFEYVITITPQQNAVREQTTGLYDTTLKQVNVRYLANGSDRGLMRLDDPLHQQSNEIHFHRSYPLLKNTFAQRNVDLLNLMNEMGWHKAFSNESLFLHLIALQKLPVSIDDVELSNNPTILIKTTKTEMEYAAICKTVRLLIAQGNCNSFEKALLIIQNINSDLWHLYFIEFKDLFFEVLSSKPFYSYLIPQICETLEITTKTNKEHPDWMSVSTMLCFHILNMLNRSIKISDGMKLNQEQIDVLRLGLTFFNQILKNSFIDNDHPEFIEHFKIQIRCILLLSFTNVEKGAITYFLIASILNNPKYKIEIFKIVNQYYAQLIVLKPEFFEHNVELSSTLFNQKFYENTSKKHETLLSKLIQHFNTRLSENSLDVLKYYDSLAPLLSQILLLKDVQAARRLNLELNAVIRKQIANILPKIESAPMLEKYIEILLLLIKFKVFEGSKENVALFSRLREGVVKIFKAFLIKNLETDYLCVNIRLLFTQSELANHPLFNNLGGKK